MVHEVNNLRANIIRTDCFGGDNSYTPQQPEEIALFDPTGLPYAPVNGTKIGQNEYLLNELVVTGQAPEKKPLLLATDVPEPPHEIKLRPTPPRKASDLIAQYGGKMQKREVNGEKQQIAILKNGKEEVKFLVNEDGTLGEQLVTLSTFGKNKYITQSEHQKRMNNIFPNGMPDGIDVNYACQDGEYYPVFTKDGKPVSSRDLQTLIAQQSATDAQNLAQS